MVDSIASAASEASPPRPAPSGSLFQWVEEHPGGAAAMVAGLALALRLVYLYQVSTTPYYLPQSLDPLFYLEWARQIAAGDWMGRDIFVQSPLYAYLLAPFVALFGEGRGTFHLIHVLQALVGTGTCLLTIQLGRRLLDPAVALLGGLLVAGYGPFLFYEGMVMKTFLSTFLTLLMVELLLRSEGTRLGTLVASGLVFALTALVRDNFVLLYPLIVIGIYFSFSRLEVRRRMRGVALFTLGAALGILPVTARNYAVGGEFALLTAGGGEVFYIGNNADANGRYLPPPFVHADPQKEHADFVAKARELTGQELSQGASSRFWLGQGLSWIGENPVAWLGLLFRKLVVFWNAYELPDNYNYLEVRHLLTRPLSAAGILLSGSLYLITFGLIAPLGLTGLALTWTRWRKLLLVYLILFGYMGTVLLFFNFSRFRVPVVPFLCLFAGVTLQAFYREGKRWVQYFSTRKPAPGDESPPGSLPAAPLEAVPSSPWSSPWRRPKRLLVGVLFLTLWFVVNFVGTGGRGVFPAIQSHLSLGDTYRVQERFQEAEEEYRVGLQILGELPLDPTTAAKLGVDPGEMRQEVESERMAQGVNFATVRAGLHFGLGATWMEQGRSLLKEDRLRGEELIREALVEIEGAAKMLPFPPYMKRLADAFLLLGQTQNAEETYRRALILSPLDFSLHYDLAGLLYESSRYPEALAELRAAREVKPDFSPAERADYHYGMGLLRLDGYRDRGRALYHMLQALESDPNHRESVRIKQLIGELREFGVEPTPED